MLKKAEETVKNRNRQLTIMYDLSNLVIADAIDKKEREDILKKFGILFDNTTDLAYICDSEGNILFVNKIFEKLTGHKPEKFIGKLFMHVNKDIITHIIKKADFGEIIDNLTKENELPRCKQAGYQKLKEIWNRSKLRGIKPTMWD